MSPVVSLTWHACHFGRPLPGPSEAIHLVIRGVNQVCSSRALQELFGFVLQVGNVLNFGAESAHAATIAGFSLASLEKVAHTKAFVGGVTLLQFVVQAVDVRTAGYGDSIRLAVLSVLTGARVVVRPCCRSVCLSATSVTVLISPTLTKRST